MTNKNYNPYDSAEHQERDLWRVRVDERALRIVPCISAWFDICGYGKILESVNWNLSSLRDVGLFDALARAYALLGGPFIVGVPPMPTERVLIINDGVARTTDLVGPQYVNQAVLLFYIRDLLITHFQLLNILVDLGLGLRTVLAGGERSQYSPASVTGSSLLHYTGEPSAFGKHLLGQQFVYNPTEFQMNTAFAMAYTIESIGAKGGVRPNRLYIAQTWLDKVNAVLPNEAVVDAGVITLPWKEGVGISIVFDDRFKINTKGFYTDIFRISSFTVHACFEGEETTFPMNNNDLIQDATL
jgi:hypothetical protein